MFRARIWQRRWVGGWQQRPSERRDIEDRDNKSSRAPSTRDESRRERAKGYPTEIEGHAEPVRAEAGEQPSSRLPKEADFTLIKGIGSAFAERLKDAGVSTFEQLAAMTPEQVGEILGLSPKRVSDDKFIEQARRLADNS
jgi:predicted flap endonuclease-1-like 5' DNA nuclease